MRAGAKAALLVAVCLGLAAISLTLRVSVGEGDPWGWLVWGYELPRGPLDTSAGPAWKPLPVIFTTPFSLFGDAAPTLWLLLTRTAWLLGLAGGYRLASRLGGSSAGVIAVLALASIAQAGEGWLADFLSGRSEMLAVPAVLWAINRHLDGHRGQALLLGLVPVLDRPVAWPFMLVYAGYLWRSEPRQRPLVASVVALGPLLWFGGDLLASGDPLATASRAQGRPLAAPSLGLVIGELTWRVARLLTAPIWVFALLAPVWPGSPEGPPEQRGRSVPAWLVGGALAWVAIVMAMAFVGFPATPRYMLPATAVLSVLAGVGMVRAVRAFPRGPARVAAAAAIAGAIVAFAAGSAASAVHHVRAEDEYAAEQAMVAALARSDAPAHLGSCGRRAAVAGGGLAKARRLAWELHLPMGRVAVVKGREAGVLVRPGVRGLVVARRRARDLLAGRSRPGRQVRSLGGSGQWGVYAINCGRSADQAAASSVRSATTARA